MGMIKSSITVVDDLNAVDNAVIAQAQKSAVGSSGGCCSGSSQGGTVSIPGFRIDSRDIRNSVVEGAIQRATVDIQGGSYSPSVIVLKKGVTAEINYRMAGMNDDNQRMLIPAYNGRLQLREGDNVIKINPEVDFFYMNWKQKFFGLILVVDDPAQAPLSDLRTRAEQYQPALPASGTGGGGCCGG
jgi:hypothetical protein